MILASMLKNILKYYLITPTESEGILMVASPSISNEPENNKSLNFGMCRCQNYIYSIQIVCVDSHDYSFQTNKNHSSQPAKGRRYK